MKFSFLMFFLPLALLFAEDLPEASPNLALHCLVSCSDGTKAEAAVDGVRSGLFWETPLTRSRPAWLEVDLGEIQTIRKLHLFLWWGGDQRHYQYYIEISTDRKQWRTLVDRRNNSVPTDDRGQEFSIPEQPARFIRLTLTLCSVNDAGHVRELEVY